MNHITICRDNYKTTEDWKNGIAEIIYQLLCNRQIMTVRYDEPGLGIVVIGFDHDDQNGSHYPVWLTPEECDSIQWET